MGEIVELSSIGDLEEKLNSARHSLTTLNENIRRFIGRGLKDSRFLFKVNHAKTCY